MSREAIDKMMLTANFAHEYGDYINAIQAAYYAMFHTVREYLEIKHPGSTTRVKTHSGLTNRFGQLAVLEDGLDARFGAMLSDMIRERFDAVYGFEANDRDAHEAVSIAETFIDHLRGKLDT